MFLKILRLLFLLPEYVCYNCHICIIQIFVQRCIFICYCLPFNSNICLRDITNICKIQGSMCALTNLISTHEFDTVMPVWCWFLATRVHSDVIQPVPLKFTHDSCRVVHVTHTVTRTVPSQTHKLMDGGVETSAERQDHINVGFTPKMKVQM